MRHTVLPAKTRYVFSRLLVFATIPKLESRRAVAQAFPWGHLTVEPATRFPSILLGGSLIPIVVYLRWGWLLLSNIPSLKAHILNTIGMICSLTTRHSPFEIHHLQSISWIYMIHSGTLFIKYIFQNNSEMSNRLTSLLERRRIEKNKVLRFLEGRIFWARVQIMNVYLLS